MNFNDIHILNDLIQDSNHRAGALGDLNHSIEEGLKEKIEQINCDLKKIHLLAVSYADIFWKELHEMHETGVEPSYIGVRVRMRDHAIEISYYTGSFTVNNPKASFRKGKYLRKSSKNQYLERDLTKLKEWEKDLIREMEKSFSYCRAMSKDLVNARRQLRHARDQLSKIC